MESRKQRKKQGGCITILTLAQQKRNKVGDLELSYVVLFSVD
jgi:hypothetical protein